MKYAISTFLGFLLTLLFACNAQNTVKSKAFDCDQLNSKQFNITLSAGGKVEGSEILSFKNKTVESSACLQYGFAAAPYTCGNAPDGSMNIETSMTSEKEGLMDWKISATETQVRGTILWVKAGQTTILYTFEGSAK